MFGKILVPIDGSPPSELGLAEAIRMARKQRASMRVLYVNQMIMTTAYPMGMIESPLISLRQAGETLLKNAVDHARAAGVAVDSVLVDVVGGQAGDEIVRQAQDWSAELIVMGTHGRRGLRRLVMGSDAEMVVRHAPVPVLLVRAPETVSPVSRAPALA